MTENYNEFYILKLLKNRVQFDNPFKVKIKSDLEVFKNIQMNDSFLLVVVKFDNKKDPKISQISLEKCKKINSNSFTHVSYATTNSPLKLENFKKLFSFDLIEDFEFNNYLTRETAIELFRDFEKSLCHDDIDFSSINPLNESNNGNDDPYTYYNNSKDISRNQYQRDKDRIIHSKAFRRLVDKAQIFTSSKGDHFRTRMTHTLEVSQIACSIARGLGLNVDLTEAIALGHDLGHTPFGHQGERTLDQILSGELDIVKNLYDYETNQQNNKTENIDKRKEEVQNLLKQGFKHNYQSLRVLTLLETKYPNYEGLNLSYEVMEGIWKHTKTKSKTCSLEDFFKYGNIHLLKQDQEFSTSLEGQVVAIADEIAQRSHDIDDAIKSHKLTPDTFAKLSNIKKADRIININDTIKDLLVEYDNKHKIFIDKNDMYRARLSSDIINHFINDVIENCEEKIKKNPKKQCTEKIIDFSQKGEFENRLLSRIISQKVINSSEVNKFDTTASRIIYKLFKYYYNNPLSLEDSTLTRIFIEMRKEMKAQFDEENENTLDLRNADMDLIREETEKIVHADLLGIKDNDTRKEYALKRKILVRCIADHISGMTDSYAINEYHKLYGI